MEISSSECHGISRFCNVTTQETVSWFLFLLVKGRLVCTVGEVSTFGDSGSETYISQNCEGNSSAVDDPGCARWLNKAEMEPDIELNCHEKDCCGFYVKQLRYYFWFKGRCQSNSWSWIRLTRSQRIIRRRSWRKAWRKELTINCFFTDVLCSGGSFLERQL